MKILLSILMTTALFLSVPGCNNADGEATCEAYNQKCPTGAPGTAAISCSADKVNNSSNGGQVEDCVENADDCPSATTCLRTLR